MSDTPAELYLIAQGVHRCVAAREAGLPGVLAQIESDGKKLGVRILPLDAIVSPKAVITRWDRGRDFWELVALLRTPTGRASIDKVFVEPVSPVRAARFTPLREVTVVEDPDEDQS